MAELSAFYPALQPIDERMALEQQLEFDRRAVLAAIEDLNDEQASARPLSATTLAVGGIVKHLALEEDRWFVVKLCGKPWSEPWASAPLGENPDWPFESAREDSVEELVALYCAACDRSRDAAAQFDSLDSLAAVVSFGKVPASLRWILVHMINETAWHLGHLDLLRDALGLPAVDR